MNIMDIIFNSNSGALKATAPLSVLGIIFILPALHLLGHSTMMRSLDIEMKSMMTGKQYRVAYKCGLDAKEKSNKISIMGSVAVTHYKFAATDEQDAIRYAIESRPECRVHKIEYKSSHFSSSELWENVCSGSSCSKA